MQETLLNNLSNNSSLSEIQDYIKKQIEIRGFGNQPVEQQLLLLIEEVGELAKAIRKDHSNMTVDQSKLQNYSSSENELADVFIVLLSICGNLDIDLFTALVNKERENINRKWSK